MGDWHRSSRLLSGAPKHPTISLIWSTEFFPEKANKKTKPFWTRLLTLNSRRKKFNFQSLHISLFSYHPELPQISLNLICTALACVNSTLDSNKFWAIDMTLLFQEAWTCLEMLVKRTYLFSCELLQAHSCFHFKAPH